MNWRNLAIGFVGGWLATTAHAVDTLSSDSAKSVIVASRWGDPVEIQRRSHEQTSIKIDGVLDEAEWQTPPTFEDFRVVEPDTLAIPAYKTEVRMFYTDKGLYVSFDLQQPANTIVKRYTVRDEFGVSRDNVSFTLDTSGEGRYGYWMNLSLGDVQMDGTIKPEREFSREWDGAWYGSTQTTDRGWAAEFFVPWSQMAMPKVEGERRIGLYLTRIVAHLDERWSWPILPETQPKFLSDLQPAKFSGVDPRQQWSLFPYASMTHDRVDKTNRYKAGVDLFWRPTSNFQLTATVNPDFGSVEADDVIVNLTADETFFPEKRLFFLEGQDVFTTSPRAETEFAPKLAVVNTRRIGARPRPPTLPPGESLSDRQALRPADLLVAAKATGQIGSFRYGVLTAFEDESSFLVNDQFYQQSGRDFGAVRVLYEDAIGAAYRGLGFVSTVVAHEESDAVVHGVDFRRLSSDGVWSVSGQWLNSDVDEKGRGSGGFTDFTYTPRQGVKHELQLTVLDDTIDINDLGFQVRNDIRDMRYGTRRVYSNLTRIRDAAVGGFLRYSENGAGQRTNGGGGTNAQATLNNLHQIDFDLSYFAERFDDRSSFGNGTFEREPSSNYAISYNTDKAKQLSVFGKFRSNSEALGGRSYQYAAGIDWRPSYNINLKFEMEFRERKGWLLHQQHEVFATFNSKQFEPKLSLDYFASARQHFRIVLQWVGVRAKEEQFFVLDPGSTDLRAISRPPRPSSDFSVSELNFQVRYRWQIAPLSDLFVVYTKGDSRVTNLEPFDKLFRQSWETPLGDQLVVKLRYRWGS